MPPSYAYHLKFELYPTPDPAATSSLVESITTPADSWRPGPGASIFDELPAQHQLHKLPLKRASQELGNDNTLRIRLPVREPVEALALGRLIDCGAAAQRKGCGDDVSGRESGSADSDDLQGTDPKLRGGQDTGKNIQKLQSHRRAAGSPSVGGTPGGGSSETTRDWRFGRIRIASFDFSDDCGTMEEQDSVKRPDEKQETAAGETEQQERGPAASLGPVLGGAGQATRARFSPLVTTSKTTDAGWGIVHLYREDGRGGNSSGATLGQRRTHTGVDDADNEDGSNGTVLCIPAVPSYLTPSDFLGFVGEAWSGDIRHCRMVLTSRTNRYMVLLKFRNAARARSWREAFDGRVFNSMEAEICHVAYIKSIAIEASGQLPSTTYFTREAQMVSASASLQSATRHTTGTSVIKTTATEVRATTAATTTVATASGAAPVATTFSGNSTATALRQRPLPPPTPNLIEMPTCPVCLERMDDTAGLMTILCQHVFHCTCLQTWKGSGCPVCRATNPAFMTSAVPSEVGTTDDSDNPFARPFGAGVSNLCTVCDCPDDLWICLICGNVGCGRYKGGHAKDHWKETGHVFSLELETQYVWDYAGDMWVHRLLRNKGDGKVVELPGREQRRQRPGHGRTAANYGDMDGDDEDNDDAADDDVVPRAKVDRIGMEYTHLLTSQLESQRVYFEEIVNKAADKAGKAAAAAEMAQVATATALRELETLRASFKTLTTETVPGLERDIARERRRADKAADLARTLNKALQEEKKVSEGLLVRVRHVQEQVAKKEQEAETAAAENAELREANRDLTMFISGQEKLRELEAAGEVAADEVEGGTMSVSEKGKGKGRRKR